jgi:hypothetical protein
MRLDLYIATALLVSAASACAEGPDAAKIGRDIDVKGARSTVASMDHQQQYDALLANVASGDPLWVRLAGRLAPGTDASDSIGLTIALAKALPKNPDAVLRVLDSGPVVGTDAVCGVPFIEQAPDEMRAYLKQAIPAVARVADSVTLPQRSACLSRLRKAEQQVDVQR